MRHVLGPLHLAASTLLLTGCKGVDHEPPPTRSTPSSQTAIPAGEQGQLVRLGRAIFDETPRYAPSYTGGLRRGMGPGLRISGCFCTNGIH
jgi:cytochrome c